METGPAHGAARRSQAQGGAHGAERRDGAGGASGGGVGAASASELQGGGSHSVPRDLREQTRSSTVTHVTQHVRGEPNGGAPLPSAGSAHSTTLTRIWTDHNAGSGHAVPWRDDGMASDDMDGWESEVTDSSEEAEAAQLPGPMQLAPGTPRFALSLSLSLQVGERHGCASSSESPRSPLCPEGIHSHILRHPLKIPCQAKSKNQVAKSAMAEGLAHAFIRPIGARKEMQS